MYTQGSLELRIRAFSHLLLPPPNPKRAQGMPSCSQALPLWLECSMPELMQDPVRSLDDTIIGHASWDVPLSGSPVTGPFPSHHPPLLTTSAPERRRHRELRKTPPRGSLFLAVVKSYHNK